MLPPVEQHRNEIDRQYDTATVVKAVGVARRTD